MQFTNTIKRLLLHANLRYTNGNCTIQDHFTILNVSSKHIKRRPVLLTSTDVGMIKKYDFEWPPVYEDNIPIVHTTITNYSKNVVAYIAGFVVRNLKKSLTCFTCLNNIEMEEGVIYDNNFMLIRRKQRGK